MHRNGDLYNISWDASFWVNNYVANQAYNRYSQMIPDIRRVQNGLEDEFEQQVNVVLKEVPTLEEQAARKLLNELAAMWADGYVKKYKELGDYLMVKYLDGNIKKEKDGEFARTPDGMPVSPVFGGYDDPRYFRSISDDAGDKLRVTTPAFK